MITSRVATKIVDAIDMALNGLGTVAPTKMPKSTKNNAPIAWEYWLSYRLYKFAQGRFNAACEKAIEADIIFDAKDRQEPVGTYPSFYRDENVFVMLEVKKPGSQVKVAMLLDYLEGKQVPKKLLDEAKKAATVPNRPSHSFEPHLNIEG